jgi:hypothetical protein
MMAITTTLRRAVAALGVAALSCLHAHGAPAAREQAEALTRAALSMAEQLLRGYGEFSPFGLGLSAGDEVVELGVAAGADPSRSANAGALRSGAVQATALVYEATIAVPSSATRSDAIAIQLTHRDGYAAIVVYPYRFENGEVVLGAGQVIEHKDVSKRSRAKRRTK